MASVWIHVFKDAAEVAKGTPIDSDVVTIGVASDNSKAFSNKTSSGVQRARIFADASCYIDIGESPTASATTIPLGSENPEFFDIPYGHIVAVITRA